MPVTDFGRIGRDAELRYTPNGDPVCNIPVAVDYGRKGQDGRKPTQWYEIALWGKQAEGLAPYLLKGKQVFFTGTDVHIETFKKGDGSEGTKLVCRCSEIKFAIDGQGQQQAPRQQAPQQQRPAPQAAPAYDDNIDQDIPF